MASDPDAMHAESLKTTNEPDDKIEYIDNMTQRIIRDTLEGTSDGAGNVHNVQDPIIETEARGVKGAHTIHNLSSELLPSVS